MKIMSHARAFTALRLTVSGVLVYLLLSQPNWPEFRDALRNANGIFIAMALGVAVLGLAVRSYKWQLLLIAQGTSYPLHELLKLNCMAIFFQNFMFGTIGGDVFRVYRTGGSDGKTGRAVTSVTMDRVTGAAVTLVLIVIAAIVGGWLPHPVEIQERIAAVGYIAALALILMLLGFRFLVGERAPKIMSKVPILGKVGGSVLDGLKTQSRDRRLLARCLWLSLVYQLLNSVGMALYAGAANLELGLVHFLFVVPLVSFIVMIPVSINGIGLQEGAFFWYLKMAGTDNSSALLVAILPRLGMFLFSLIGALIYVADRRRRRPHEVGV